MGYQQTMRELFVQVSSTDTQAYTQSEQNEFFTVCLVRKEEYLLLSSHTNWKVLTELTGETDSTNCQP